MFRAAIAQTAWVQEAQPIRSRPWQPPVVESPIYGVRVWHFPRVDVWPVTGEGCPTPNDTGPLMDMEPVAEEEQTQLSRAPAQPTAVPKNQKPRMVVWMRPAYTLDWAWTELEGTVRLGFRIRPTGGTYRIEIEQSSGSQKLDATAVEAAKSWRFTSARWQGRSIDGEATVDLTFRFFEYSGSRADDQAVTSAARKAASRTVQLDRSEMVRRLVDQLRPKTTMRDWGPISSVQYLRTIASKSVAVRWELYRVAHDDREALWEVGLDPTGGVSAAKAESLETLDRVNNSGVVCKSNDRGV
jgi:TonB family protein